MFSGWMDVGQYPIQVEGHAGGLMDHTGESLKVTVGHCRSL